MKLLEFRILSHRHYVESYVFTVTGLVEKTNPGHVVILRQLAGCWIVGTDDANPIWFCSRVVGEGDSSASPHFFQGLVAFTKVILFPSNKYGAVTTYA
jgi:hypothetical protein